MSEEVMGEAFSQEKYETAQTLNQTDKKCPMCDGTMNYDPASGDMLCQYCGYKMDLGEFEKAEEQSFLDAEKTANCNWGAEKKTVICKNCGAQTVYDALETAGECPYCGSNQVMEAFDDATMAPNGVCPFKIDKPNAIKRFVNWIKKKLFCPSDLKKSVGKKEKLDGIYLPYWTFDSQTESSYHAQYGKNRVVTVGSGKNRHTKVVTDWYSTNGHYSYFANDTLVIASTRHSKEMLSGIEPFNTESSVVYQPEFMSGFAAERYSIGIDDAWKTAKNKINGVLNSRIESYIKSCTGADIVSGLSFTTKHYDITYKYLMLPVWMSSFEYKGKKYRFMINGQTGKIYGKTPVSPLRVLAAVLIGIAALIALSFIIRYM